MFGVKTRQVISVSLGVSTILCAAGAIMPVTAYAEESSVNLKELNTVISATIQGDNGTVEVKDAEIEITDDKVININDDLSALKGKDLEVKLKVNITSDDAVKIDKSATGPMEFTTDASVKIEDVTTTPKKDENNFITGINVVLKLGAISNIELEDKDSHRIYIGSFNESEISFELAQDRFRVYDFSIADNRLYTLTYSDEGGYPYKEGTKVHIKLNKDSDEWDKYIDGILLIGEDETRYEATDNGDGTYDFIMPNQNVQIYVKSLHEVYTVGDPNIKLWTSTLHGWTATGREVTIRVENNTSKKVTGIQLKLLYDGSTIYADKQPDGTFKFTMPDSPVEMTAITRSSSSSSSSSGSSSHHNSSSSDKTDDNDNSKETDSSLSENSNSSNGNNNTIVVSSPVTSVNANWKQNADGSWSLKTLDGQTLTGWQLVNNKWYLMNSTGIMQTGWNQVSGKWYLMDNSGAMRTGWQNVNGKWYLLKVDGAMATGWQQVGGSWYYLYGNGEMAANTTINGYKVGVDGAWIK